MAMLVGSWQLPLRISMFLVWITATSFSARWRKWSFRFRREVAGNTQLILDSAETSQ
ncbi:MAG TPA: hypothetical protein VHM93_22600 [Candidatus Acidoferrum sp.]|nr:hypothetical protein [Candidatus Acidoferrum sp.]